MFERFKESVRNFIFNPSNQATRDGYAVNRTEQQESTLQLVETKAEEAGNLDKIVSVEKQMSLMDRKELVRLFDQFVQLRLLTHQILKKLHYLSFLIHEDIDRDKALSQEQKDRLTREIDGKILESYAFLDKFVNDIFQAETSFTNANMKNLIEKMQATEVVVRSLPYEYTQAKNATRAAERKEDRLIKRARHPKEVENKEFIEEVRELNKLMKEDTERLEKAADETILVLQKKTRSIAAKKRHFEHLLTEAHFPPIIGEGIIKQFDDNLRFFHEQLQREVQMKRTELSDLKQLRPAA